MTDGGALPPSALSLPPKYAVIRLKPTDDVLNLFSLLIDNGYPEVSFVHRLKDGLLSPWTLHKNDDGSLVTELPPEPTVITQSGSEAGSEKHDETSPTRNSSTDSDSNNQPGPLLPPDCSGRNDYAPPRPIPILPLVPQLFGTNVAHFGVSGPFRPQIPQLPISALSLPQSQSLYLNREVSTPPYSLSAELERGRITQGVIHQTFHASNKINYGATLLPITTATNSITTEPPVPNLNSAESHYLPYTSPATTQLRQRGSRAQSDDPNVFVACRLCHNKIMASRLSNLTNHVRRHSTLKQFQCCYCDYTHNEMAKVRLHMLHNHKDKDSQPIDNLSPEMQTSWSLLMRQCFPNHYQGTNSQAQPPLIPYSQAQEQTEPPAYNHSSTSCADCGEVVAEKNQIDHIQRQHIDCCPYVCSSCSYENVDARSVMFHVATQHPNDAVAKVFTRDILTIAEALIPKYFPESRPPPPQSLISSTASLSEPIPKPLHVLNPAKYSPPPVLHQAPPMMSAVGRPISHHHTRPNGLRSLIDQKMAGNLQCQLCRKVLDGIRPLSSLLNHAKRHYHLKQFQCTECPYSSSEAAHVRSHMNLKHNIKGKPPLDSRTPVLQAAWMQTMLRCFPGVAPRLKKFRFKNFRNKPSGRPRNRVGSDAKSSTTTESTADDSDSCASRRASNTSDQSASVDEPTTKGDEKRKCQLCGDAFPADNADELFQHATTHIPMKPFGCSVCQFRSSDYQQLRAHFWKHKLKGGERVRPRLAGAEIAALRAEYVKYCFGE